MRLPSSAAVSGSLLMMIAMTIAACTAAGSTTTVQGPDGTSGTSGTAPVFPGATDGTDAGTDMTTGPTDYTALFGPPASTKTTANSLNGLWAGTDRGQRDTRMVFSASSVVIAKRCHTSSTDASGIKVTSLVTSSSIKTLESQMAAGADAVTCDLSVKPAQVARCTSVTDSEAQIEASNGTSGCFFLNGTTLNFYGTFLDGWKLTKLSDTAN